MISRRVQLISILFVLLASCSGASRPVEIPVDPFPPEFSEARLGNATYTLVDSSLRTALTDSSLDFSVTLKNGMYEFPSAMNRRGYKKVRADLKDIAYGDVDGDSGTDAVFPLIIERKEDAVLEIVAVSSSGASVKHFASFPLGIAQLNSLSITNGKIRVNFVHQVTGDPGPRNTELLLEIPKSNK